MGTKALKTFICTVHFLFIDHFDMRIYLPQTTDSPLSGSAGFCSFRETTTNCLFHAYTFPANGDIYFADGTGSTNKVVITAGNLNAEEFNFYKLSVADAYKFCVTDTASFHKWIALLKHEIYNE